MRWSPFLVLMSGVALADASAPTGRAVAPAAPSTIERVASSGGGGPHETMYEVGTRLFATDNGRRLTVLERGEKDYLVDDGGKQVRRTFSEMTPFAFTIDGHAVTVAFGDDFKIHVRVAGGGELELRPAGEGYLSRKGGDVTAALVNGAAPVALVKIGSHPEACSDFYDVYVSVVDGVPRRALELSGVVDAPIWARETAKFDRAGTVVVTQRSGQENDAPTKIRRTRYRWNGRVYETQRR